MTGEAVLLVQGFGVTMFILGVASGIAVSVLYVLLKRLLFLVAG